MDAGGGGLDSGLSFGSVSELDVRLGRQLEYLGFKTMTVIQAKSIPELLSGSEDVLLRSQTGSGKTLAFLVPALHRIVVAESAKRKALQDAGLLTAGDLKTVVLDRTSGTRVLVLGPTRELVTQTYEVAKKLLQPFYWMTTSTLVCGTKKKGEKAALRKGVTVLCATPGRILDHMNTTNAFKLDKVSSIVIDEADRLLDAGFESKLKKLTADIRDARDNATHFRPGIPPSPAPGISATGISAKNRKAARGRDEEMIVDLEAVDHTVLSRFDDDEDSDEGDGTAAVPQTAKAEWNVYETALSLQTVMVSATLTERVEKLANFCLRKGYRWITDDTKVPSAKFRTALGGDEVEDENQASDAAGGADVAEWSMPKTLKQSAVVVENMKKRVLTLLGLLLVRQDIAGSRTLVFVDTCEVAEYLFNVVADLKWPTLPDDKTPRAVKERAEKELKETSSKVKRALDVNDILFGEDDDQAELLQKSDRSFLWSDEPVFGKLRSFRLHGSMDKDDRTGTLADFVSSKPSSQVLFVTDVAARGLNFPEVDLVVQFDVACELCDYVHRVGRTARMGRPGTSVLFLNEHEKGFLNLLRQKGVAKEIQITHQDHILKTLRPNDRLAKTPPHLASLRPADAASFILSRFTAYVEANPVLCTLASRAYFATVKNYRTYAKELRTYFDANQLHLGRLAGGFMLRQSPFELSKKEERPPTGRGGFGSRDTYSRDAGTGGGFGSRGTGSRGTGSRGTGSRGTGSRGRGASRGGGRGGRDSGRGRGGSSFSKRGRGDRYGTTSKDFAARRVMKKQKVSAA
ncbi:helicase [Gregarina niphandrodes]|uniref:ATP-dependent RNA helicase n=1 Tax=Gregarina niphandrodes TaxID=110365 RepID=A0A023B2E1_GRENI|nr:helicase [Gregarina niphandrodes]EZG51807.1 helicase [Gregarina niphandrodes]|eukprot:XP_011131918.1 helicase [Gregarina niphandrodes]